MHAENAQLALEGGHRAAVAVGAEEDRILRLKQHAASSHRPPASSLGKKRTSRSGSARDEHSSPGTRACRHASPGSSSYRAPGSTSHAAHGDRANFLHMNLRQRRLRQRPDRVHPLRLLKPEAAPAPPATENDADLALLERRNAGSTSVVMFSGFATPGFRSWSWSCRRRGTPAVPVPPPVIERSISSRNSVAVESIDVICCARRCWPSASSSSQNRSRWA